MNHSFNIEVAKEYGLEESIILENIIFWLKKNQANNKHFYDDDYWTYNSTRAFTELFPYWTERQIQRILKSLEQKNLIKTGNYNKVAYDRTKWYGLTEKGKSIYAKREMDLQEKGNGFTSKVEPIPDINTDIKNKYKNIFDYYISAGLVKHKEYTPAIEKALKLAEKELLLDEDYFKRIIDRHKQRYKATIKKEYPVKLRGLSELFGQKKHKGTGLICSDYLDEVWVEVKSVNKELGSYLNTEERMF